MQGGVRGDIYCCFKYIYIYTYIYLIKVANLAVECSMPYKQNVVYPNANICLEKEKKKGFITGKI